MACIEGPVAAGVVADLTTKANRGVMMGTFVLSIFAANATGEACFPRVRDAKSDPRLS